MDCCHLPHLTHAPAAAVHPLRGAVSVLRGSATTAPSTALAAVLLPLLTLPPHQHGGAPTSPSLTLYVVMLARYPLIRPHTPCWRAGVHCAYQCLGRAAAWAESQCDTRWCSSSRRSSSRRSRVAVVEIPSTVINRRPIGRGSNGTSSALALLT